MANLTLIDSKSEDEEILEETEEIQLPLFDIIENEDENWFSEMIREINELIKQNHDNNIH